MAEQEQSDGTSRGGGVMGNNENAESKPIVRGRRGIGGLTGLSFDEVPDADSNATTSSASGNVALTNVAALLTNAPEVTAGPRMHTLYVSPKKCKMWRLHDRSADWYTPARCDKIIESIRADKQKMPAVARALKDDPDGYLFEIIVGGRRRYSCEYLDIPLLIEPQEISDADAYRLMVIENEEREDISLAEKAMRAARTSADGLFKTQAEQAAAEKVPTSSLSELLTIGRFLLADGIINSLGGVISINRKTAVDAARVAETIGLNAFLSIMREQRLARPEVNEEVLLVIALREARRMQASPSRRVEPKKINGAIGANGVSFAAQMNAKGCLSISVPASINSYSEDDFLSAMKELYRNASGKGAKKK